MVEANGNWADWEAKHSSSRTSVDISTEMIAIRFLEQIGIFLSFGVGVGRRQGKERVNREATFIPRTGKTFRQMNPAHR